MSDDLVSDHFPAASFTTNLDKAHVNPEPVGMTTSPPSQAFEMVAPDTATLPAPAQKVGATTAFLKRARLAVRAVDAPTWGLDLREISDGIEAARSRAVIDLAMRIAESTLSTGASAADVTAGVLAVTKAYGLRSVHVDVTFTSISVTHHRGAAEDPVTMVRIVRVRVPDYERLADTHRLVADIADGDVPLEQAQKRFFDIMGRPHLYRRWVITGSFFFLGGGVAALMGGRPVEILLAMVIAVVVDRVNLWAGKRQLAAFFAQMLGGAIPTVVAMTIIALRAAYPGIEGLVRPSVLVATGIVVLLAGLSVVGAAQDAIDGYYVTAGARTFEVVVLTLGILVGVLAVISLASKAGVPAYLIPTSSLASSVPLQLVAVGLIAFSYALGCYAGVRTIIVSVGMAVLGWGVYVLCLRAEFDSVSATAVACLVVGLVSHPSAWLFKVPSLAVSTAGIVAFLPGGMVYRGLYYLVEPAPVITPTTDGPTLLMMAGATGLAIAGGVSLGGYFGRRIRPDPRGGQSLRRGAPPVAE